MRRLAKIVAVLAASGMTALAAPDGSAPAAPPAPPELTAAKVMSVMSVGEMNVAAANLEVRIEEDGQQMLHLQEIAKKQKDVIKLNCVNDHLVQFKPKRNIADELHAQLNLALQNNSEDRNPLFGKFSATADSIKEIHEDAKTCIGAPELSKQETGLTVDHPPFPDDPTTVMPVQGNVTFEPPAFASPFD
jgi:hypothetical protein